MKTEGEDNLNTCPACYSAMHASAWMCTECQHVKGWRSHIGLWIPILSLLVAFASLAPAARQAISPKRGSVSISGSHTPTGALTLSIVNLGAQIVKLGSSISCTGNYNYKDESASFEFRLSSSQPIAIKSGERTKAEYQFGYLEKVFSTNVRSYGTTVPKEIVSSLKEESILQGFSCRLALEDSIGKLPESDAYSLWIEGRNPALMLSFSRDPSE